MSKKCFSLLIIHILIFVLAVISYIGEVYYSFDGIWSFIILAITPLLGTFAGLYTAKVYGFKNPNGIAILFIASGLFFWFLAEITWLYFDYFLNIYPFPALPDVFYILAYPLIFIGIYKKIRIEKKEASKQQKIIFFTLSSVLIVGISLFMFAISFDSELGFWGIFANTLYNISDAILFLMAFMVLVIAAQNKEGKLFAPWLVFAIAIFFMYIADFLFAFFAAEYEEGLNIYYIIIDLTFVLSYLIFSCSLFHIGVSIQEVRKKFLKQ